MRRASSTRWSTLSNRPQTRVRPCVRDRRRAAAWSKGRPLGERQITGHASRSAGVPSAAWSSAAAITSARSTMPAPPPAGGASTVRWRPRPKPRRSTVSSAQSPRSSARPVSDSPSVPGKACGKSVTTLARQAPATRRSAPRSRGRSDAWIASRPWLRGGLGGDSATAGSGAAGLGAVESPGVSGAAGSVMRRLRSTR